MVRAPALSPAAAPARGAAAGGGVGAEHEQLQPDEVHRHRHPGGGDEGQRQRDLAAVKHRQRQRVHRHVGRQRDRVDGEEAEQFARVPARADPEGEGAVGEVAERRAGDVTRGLGRMHVQRQPQQAAIDREVDRHRGEADQQETREFAAQARGRGGRGQGVHHVARSGWRMR
nr:hypothetical protein [Lysobacter enzymogenes]